MSITLRNVKGTALTYGELDDNFTYLSQSYLPASATASLSVTSASYAATSSVSNTASYAISASHAIGYLPILGGTISGSLTIIGTASISYLNVTVESSSVIYSSGSNQFGDASNDIQILYGTVIISGSQQITGSVNAPNITGSLFGTSSQAISASYASASEFSVSSSVAITSSFSLTASFLSGSAISSSYAVSASFAISSSVAISASWATSASRAISASRADFAVSSSYPIATTGTNNLYSTKPLAGIPSFGNSNVLFFGRDAGSGSAFLQSANVLGDSAGRDITGTVVSSVNFFGTDAGRQAIKSSNSNFLGFSAGKETTNAQHSNFIGRESGQYTVSASYSTFIGYNTGKNTLFTNGVGPNNIIIGTNITLEDGRQDSINLGGILFGTGSNSSLANIVSGSANGKIGINQPLPEYSLDVSGSGRYTQGLIVSGTLIAPDITGSLFGIASYALTASFVLNASTVNTASLVTTSSFNSYTSSNASTFAGTASYALTASFLLGSITSASYAATASRLEGTASWSINSISASMSISASVAISASFAQNTISASYAYTASSATSSSFAQNTISASYAFTASSAESASRAVSSSHAQTASFLTGTVATASLALQSQYPFFVSGTTIASHDAFVAGGSAGGNFIAGVQAGQSMTNNYNSVIIGYQAGRFTSGLGNTQAIGELAGQSATNGYDSNFFGYAAGYAATNAYRSNFIGNQAGWNAASANNSMFLGYQAGRATSTALSVGRNCIIIGTKVSLPAGTQDAMNIGGTLFGKNFYFNAGGDSVSGSVGGSIGINVVDPQYNLDISGSVRQQNGFAILSQVSASLNFANDTAAAAGGVPLGGLYRNGNVIQIRLV